MVGYLLIAVSAIGFGLMPIFAVYAYDAGLSVFALLFLRFLIAAVLLLGYVRWSRRRHHTPGPTRNQVMRLALLGGVLYTAQSALYFASVQYISPALAALLLYLYPVLVTAVAAAVGRRRPTALTVLALVVALVGVALALGGIDWRLSLLGVLEALGAACVYTAYILIGDRACSGIPSTTMAAYISLFASGSFLLLGLGTGSLPLRFAPSGWIPVIGVAIFSTVVAVVCFFLGMARVGPTSASIGSMLEPVATVAVSAVLLSSALDGLQVLGAALVIGGATAGVLARGQDEARAAVPGADVRSAR